MTMIMLKTRTMKITENEDVGTDKDKREMQPRKMVSISDNHCITVSERVRKTVSVSLYQKWRMETWSKAQGLDPAHIKQGFVHRGSCGN